jgi:hypothetical protein
MEGNKRQVAHHNNKPFLLVGDTPWALPFRGTTKSVTKYAKDRQKKGSEIKLEELQATKKTTASSIYSWTWKNLLKNHTL